MSSIEESLRATSDTLMSALEILERLETEKRSLVPGDPRLVTLSSEIEDIAEQVLGASAAQRGLSEDAQRLVRAGATAAPTSSIDDTPRSPTVILAEWRTVERDAAAAAPGSVTQARLRDKADRLRQEYRAAFERSIRPH